MHKVVAIVGPTSSGKTALSIWLAKQIQKDFGGAEIISADSRQVYKGLNLGTGKVTKKEMGGVPHHLLDVVSPKKQFSVDDFIKKSEKAFKLILKKKKTPIVVGGTGLYVDMLLGRMAYPNVPPNIALRKKLEKKSSEELFEILTKLDPARASTIERHNSRRLIRAIEIAKKLGLNPPALPEPSYNVLWIGLNPGETVLKNKIRLRLNSRIKAGMVAEAKKLHKKGLSYKRMNELGLEYRSLTSLLQGKLTLTEMRSELERAIYQYSKRQMRWFKRNKDIAWVSSTSQALALARKFIGSGY